MSKSLSKTQKRTDSQIRKSLTDICDQLLEDIPGFRWLTHQANYANFPASLIITCIFATRDDQNSLPQNAEDNKIRKLIQSKLLSIGVKVPAPIFQIRWDNEQDCEEQHEGNWKQRLKEREGLAAPRNRPN